LADPVLVVSNLSKRFGNLQALQAVTFSLEKGEVVGIVGRRGSGKSTLLQILGGSIAPSAGEFFFRNQRLRFPSPAAARELGIELVGQSPMLIESMDILENIFLGREIYLPHSQGMPDWGAMIRRANEILADFDPPPNLLSKKVGNLTDEMRQVVAINRALCVNPRLILLDDSLATLSYPRQQLLLEKIQQLAQEGVSVLISSDNLNHLFSVTNRILVLYEGRLTADRLTAECTPRDIVELIVGMTNPEQVTPIIWALESFHAAQQQTEELSRVQVTLRQNLEAQDSLNRQLIQRLRNQLEALDHLNAALQSAQRRLMTEREEERKALARDLHDQVIQDLLSFNYRLEEAEGNKIPSALKKDLGAIRNGIRQVVSDLRQICSDLRPPTIDSHGLSAAITSLAQEWAERAGMIVQLEIDPNLGRMPEAIELSVFRIVQEGLNNIRKHAAAKNVVLRMQRTPTASLYLQLSDDGEGPKETINLAKLSADKHFGLLGVSERVALLGGTLNIDSPPGGGLVIQVEIPSPYPTIQE
jgi:signal transduction histidine kinase